MIINKLFLDGLITSYTIYTLVPINIVYIKNLQRLFQLGQSIIHKRNHLLTLEQQTKKTKKTTNKKILLLRVE